MGRYVVVNGITHDLDALLANLLRRPSTATPDGVTVGVTSTTVLAANENRNFAAFVNDSDETMYLALGAAAVLHKGIRMNASGGSYEINATNMFTGVVYAICASGSKKLTLNYG